MISGGAALMADSGKKKGRMLAHPARMDFLQPAR
jgi:hypothetical protein